MNIKKFKRSLFRKMLTFRNKTERLRGHLGIVSMFILSGTLIVAKIKFIGFLALFWALGLINNEYLMEHKKDLKKTEFYRKIKNID